ncbi:VOC family protein [Raineyella fluvialis]|uniref:VOC family protein n=1 Tax=Raineyella fluvialis TaxID=2662261 RepID=A0A5Q2FE46_9ACTN|nr:VOC family protein [Raineyella fluvialis]QGF23734.1 VOC family protein [Raineyella fluvialis]
MSSAARPVHFEIQADDLDRARAFYTEVFGWEFQDWSGPDFTYLGITTGEEGTPGINGGLLPRPGGSPAMDQPINAYVVTMSCDDFDAYAERILAHGGEVALPKQALMGMAWQGYFKDTEGNIFGLHQPDPNAA